VHDGNLPVTVGPSKWRAAAVWALPFSLWLAVTLGSALALPVRIGEWMSLHRSYAYDAENNGGEAVDAMHSVDLQQLLEVLANLGVLGLGVAAALVYRRRVPLHWRGTWRAFAIAVVAVGGLALVGYIVIASALKGAIKG
jgi:hypothetical protein